jgi:hypothetical protein
LFLSPCIQEEDRVASDLERDGCYETAQTSADDDNVESDSSLLWGLDIVLLEYRRNANPRVNSTRQ